MNIASKLQDVIVTLEQSLGALLGQETAGDKAQAIKDVQEAILSLKGIQGEVSEDNADTDKTADETVTGDTGEEVAAAPTEPADTETAPAE